MLDKINSLTQKIVQQETDIQEATEILEFETSRLNCFIDYFNAVYNNVMLVQFASQLRDAGRISQEEFEFRLVNSDEKRRIVHESAIDACAQLNRLCERYGAEKFCPDTTDRHIIADFVGNFVYNIYQTGINISKDNIGIDDAIEIAEKNRCNGDKAYKEISVKEVEDWSR